MTSINLTLQKDSLKATEKEATFKAEEIYGVEDSKNYLEYELRFDISEMYFDDDSEKLVINGSLFSGKEELGMISSYDLPIDLDLVVRLVQSYIKKLNKLKTVLEATK